MFVVDVCTLRVPSRPRLSAGSPLLSVIATNEAHVLEAYWYNVAFALGAPVLAAAGDGADSPKVVDGGGDSKDQDPAHTWCLP